MKRVAVVMLLFAVWVASAAPSIAQVYRGRYGAYYRPYPPPAAYWNGYYSRPGGYYRPYSTYYSYPSGYSWGYPRTYGYYAPPPAYYAAPPAYYGYPWY